MRVAFTGGYQITNPFGTYDPIVYAAYPGGKHPGTDWGMPIGTRLYAGMDGYLTRQIWGATVKKGNEAIITNGDKQRRYGHMMEIVRADGPVKEGDFVGYSGNTGYSTGPHLHDELLIDGIYVDVTKYLGEENNMFPNNGDLDNFSGRTGWPGHPLNANDRAYWTQGTGNPDWSKGADAVWKSLEYEITDYALKNLVPRGTPSPDATQLKPGLYKV